MGTTLLRYGMHLYNEAWSCLAIHVRFELLFDFWVMSCTVAPYSCHHNLVSYAPDNMDTFSIHLPDSVREIQAFGKDAHNMNDMRLII